MRINRRDLMLTASALFGLGSSLRSFSQPQRRSAPADVFQLSWDRPVVDTSAGRIRGFVYRGISTFKGIPYGATTDGDARFAAPRPPTVWTDIRDTLLYGPVSPQPRRSFAERYAFVQALDLGTMGEDCLRLNVWTPARKGDPGHLPVMFWLHEGGFHTGSSQEHAWYDGTNLARRGVVVVTINHRVNAFGFLNLTDFGDQFRESANAGLLDIVAALQWVRTNIGQFGGNPGNVTIFGQSGGGAKVNCLLTMPSARGLFHKAIAQSPLPAITDWEAPTRSQQFGAAVVSALGLSRRNIDDIRRLPFEAIAEAVTRAVRARADPTLYGFPTVDGVVLPEPPFNPSAPAISSSVPLMIGSTMREGGPIMRPDLAIMTDEALQQRVSDRYGGRSGSLLAAFKRAYPGAPPIDIWAQIDFERVRRVVVLQAERKAAQGQAPVYTYLFTWRSKVFGGMLGAFHGSEVAFVFDNVDEHAPFTGGTAEARALAERISNAWVTFARVGNPNHRGLPAWMPVSTNALPTMIFDTRDEVRVNHDRDARELLAER